MGRVTVEALNKVTQSHLTSFRNEREMEITDHFGKGISLILSIIELTNHEGRQSSVGVEKRLRMETNDRRYIAEIALPFLEFSTFQTKISEILQNFRSRN